MDIVLGYQDLALLPYCLYTVLVFSGRKFKYDWLCFALLLVPLLYSVFVTLTGPARAHPFAFLAPVGYLCLSLIIRLINWSAFDEVGRLMLRLGAWLGGISYGIYIIHAPSFVLVGQINVFSNQLFNYLLKLGVLFTLIILTAYLLEKIFQPWIRNLLAPKRKVGSA